MRAAIDSLAYGVLAPFDHVRAQFFRYAGPALSPLLRDRHARIRVVSVLAVGLAFAGAVFAPLVMLAAGPLLLGVPHLLADLRYLVVRQQLHKRTVLAVSVGPLLGAQWLFPSTSLGLVSVAVAAACARASLMARAATVLASLCLAGLAYPYAAAAALLFAHGHNLVALVLWVAWARGRRGHVAPGVFAFALGAFAILSGFAETRLLSAHAVLPLASALDVDTLARGLVPRDMPQYSLRLLLLFAFAQSVHYAVWTRLLPEEDRLRNGPRSYRASYSALVRDLGALTVLVCFALSAYFALRGLTAPAAARTDYLRFALFHGPLELSVLVLFALERRTFRHEGSP